MRNIPSLFIVILLITAFYNCKGLKISSNNIYEDIYEHQLKKFGNDYPINALNIYRKECNSFNLLHYSPHQDTLFIVESLGIQGEYRYSVWNKKDTISFENEAGKLQLSNDLLFAKYMMDLIADWNLQKIEGEAINSNLISNELIYATKIIYNNKKTNLETIRFQDFSR